VQAGDDLVLKRMRRRHLRADVIRATERLHALRPGLAFGADLIAGFPTEDEAMFGRTLDLVAEAGLTYLHVFPYSPREGTPAARMPQVPKAVAKERASRLRAAGDAALESFLAAQVGTRRRALVERDGTGHTDHFAPVRIDGPAPPPGTIGDVAVSAAASGMLVGAMA
jgi:threonylcarbamoyladenosine tRNA methylthiotransferase MtaB